MTSSVFRYGGQCCRRRIVFDYLVSAACAPQPTAVVHVLPKIRALLSSRDVVLSNGNRQTHDTARLDCIGKWGNGKRGPPLTIPKSTTLYSPKPREHASSNCNLFRIVAATGHERGQ